jgi:plasmid stabilization system protein ParE
MKPRFTRRAIGQIRDIRDHIADNSPSAAQSFVRRVAAIADLVALHPSIGRPTSMGNVRVFGALPYPYLVFYRIEESGTVLVLRVRHMARGQDWRKGR